ncbi:spermidine synthase [Seinonella peptonophila]|uniref:Polyamine aminopropyltransferase n=1 Tax=Seinonella peptonophila TaxID=112248 RepID=A0A1M4V1Y7_9BACL|nr:polyamine aminopropyltransferase [Seinonella peptonophila]SHE62949.1 spermidine synthase [Seinonella peptonophila]
MGNLDKMQQFEFMDGGYWFTEDERMDYEGDFHFRMGYRVKDLIYAEQTPIQLITILDTYTFGRTLFLDGGIQTTERDGFIYNEMMAHVPLSIHPHPRKVCVIGGGDGGVVSEVTKYPEVEQIDHVEIDPNVIQACIKYLPSIASRMDDLRIRSIYMDASKYVQENQEKYDVMIVDAADPMGPAKILFTEGFFRDIKRSLRNDGLMIIQSHPLYFQQELTHEVFHRISHLFPITKLCTATVPSYPGALQSFVVGSNQYANVKTDFNKDTKYVNRDVIEASFAIPQNFSEFKPIIRG